jgi:hypothetical protein
MAAMAALSAAHLVNLRSDRVHQRYDQAQRTNADAR